MRVTIEDIAERLNLNKSTVSYALNGKGSVKDKTRALVKKTAAEMGYVPNQSARQTSTGKSNEVAIVVPNIISIYGEFCEYAFQKLSDAGIHCSICISEFSAEREKTIVNNLIGRGVAGILIAPSMEFDSGEDAATMNLLQKNAIPVICRSEHSKYSGVGVNFKSIGKRMGDELHRKQRKNVCIASPLPPPFYADITGLFDGLKESLGDSSEISIEYLDEKERTKSLLDYGYVARQMLTSDWYSCHRKLFHKIFDRKDNPPDAIVSPTESCLMGIMNEARSCGVEIPRQVSIIAGTRNVGGFVYPDRLSAVYVPEERIAAEMVNQLIDHIRNHKELRDVQIEPVFYAGSTL